MYTFHNKHIIDTRMKYCTPKCATNIIINGLNGQRRITKRSHGAIYKLIVQRTNCLLTILIYFSVAMTACINSSPTLSSGSVVRFNNIRKNIGISSISSFQNSGKFTCEYEGLYLVSSWILSNTDESQFAIYYNGQSLASAYVMYDAAPEINVGTATAIVSVELKVGDTVWVQTKNRMFVGYQGSCFTIAKLK